MAEDYLDEIFEQPRVLAALANAFEADYATALAKLRPLMASGALSKIVMTGMGGSLHGLYPTLLRLSNALPIPVSLWDCGELIQQAPTLIDDRTLLIAVSQSGESGELVRLCQSALRPRVSIAVTSSGRNTLAHWCDISLCTNAGPERTASTKTYTAGLATLALLCCALLGEDLGAQRAAVQSVADAIEAHLPAWRDASRALVQFLGAETPIVFVGRGANFATAAMASLLTGEAAKLTCVPYSAGQFRHGPIELVREGFRCVVLGSPEPELAALDRGLADTVIELTGGVAWMAGDGSRTMPRAGQHVIELPACDASCLPILNVVPLQLLQIPLAIARGFAPAQFLNASKVTTIL